jgi:hypothetical protein
MTATTVPTSRSTSTTSSRSTTSSTTSPSWKTGAVAGLTAAAATTAVAAVAHAAGVSFETAPGEAIPVLGFAQLTLLFTAVGVVLAKAMARWARHPRSTFVKTTVALTALSLLPDLALHADTATKLVLMATHVIAAAIVIPKLATRQGA